VAVLSLVTARIAPERQREVADAYRNTVDAGLPPAIRETFLLVADDGSVAIATIWNSREALDQVRRAPEEPFARRVLREAGGDPQAQFFEVVAEAASGSR
jgi:heme-degrading monooxygenase HmoA